MAIGAKKNTAASIKDAERTQGFRDFLAAADEAFNAFPASGQNAIAGLLYKAHLGIFTHNSGVAGVFPIHWESKQRKFGSAASFDKLNNALGWFYKVHGAKIGESAEAWTMTARAKKLLADYHDQGKQQHLPFYDVPDASRAFVDQENRTCRKPQSPIASKAASGANTNFKVWDLPLNVYIDGDNLHAFLHAVSARYHGGKCPRGFGWAWSRWDEVEKSKGREGLERKLSETLGQASEFLRTAWASKLKGFVVHQSYEETDSGRLVAQGVLNLQSCHREVRKASLPSHYDYDVECCHYALLGSLARRAGMLTPLIDAYTADKQKLRIEVQMASGSGGSYDDAKAVLTSLIYGAPLTASPLGSIAARVGTKAAERIIKLQPLVDLHGELKAARDAVLATYKPEVQRTGRITNAAKRRIPAKGVHARKLLAHILTGEESEVLKVAIAYASADIVLLAHDGFVTTKPIDKAGLEARIEYATGHRLSIVCKQFAPAAHSPQN